jgi:hypothetical protein
MRDTTIIKKENILVRKLRRKRKAEMKKGREREQCVWHTKKERKI